MYQIMFLLGTNPRPPPPPPGVPPQRKASNVGDEDAPSAGEVLSSSVPQGKSPDNPQRAVKKAREARVLQVQYSRHSAYGVLLEHKLVFISYVQMMLEEPNRATIRLVSMW